ncbi:hypothetical protein PCL1606_31830 [Pseudomonas chlororaphis]|uniref:Uncharacterized protein n=1 Tax=Pseudomonas chlororaphis TaxID=587753 RepID=A0A0D5Y0Z8_9PSED|nr:hypothetical protein PCL1606_31830 [Pseudomonas chlororaphis]
MGHETRGKRGATRVVEGWRKTNLRTRSEKWRRRMPERRRGQKGRFAPTPMHRVSPGRSRAQVLRQLRCRSQPRRLGSGYKDAAFPVAAVKRQRGCDRPRSGRQSRRSVLYRQIAKSLLTVPDRRLC